LTKTILKRAVAIILGASLASTAILEIPSVTTTQAQAASKIPYSQYQSDLNGVNNALKIASAYVRGNVIKDLPTDPQAAYTDISFPDDSFYGYFNDFGSYAAADTDEQQSLNSFVASYKIFRSRLSHAYQIKLDSMISDVQDDIDNAYDVTEDFESLGATLGDAVADYSSHHDGVAKPVTANSKSSYISKLSVKRISSKKYVKIVGTVKLYKSANYARIKTYKGTKYTKLSSKHTFSKTVYAPKAKTVQVTVGHYSHGHFTSVTSAKTVYVR